MAVLCYTLKSTANLDMPEHEELAIDWMQTHTGRRLLRDSKPSLEELVRRCHGDTLLWCGGDVASLQALQRSIVRHRFFVSDELQTVPEGVIRLVAETGKLPFANNSMDAIILHHALEPLTDPRDALREMARVLHPGGRLVIVAFNPWSTLGARRLYARLRPDAFSSQRFVNPVRLLDWLRLLGLELEEPVRFRSTGLPFRIRKEAPKANPASTTEVQKSARVRRRDIARRQGIEIPLGDVFMVSAVKQAYYVRPRRVVTEVPVTRLAGVAYPRTVARLVPGNFRKEPR